MRFKKVKLDDMERRSKMYAQSSNVEFQHQGQKFVYDAEADKRQQEWIEKHPITQATNAAIEEFKRLKEADSD